MIARHNARNITCLSEAPLPTEYGLFTAFAYVANDTQIQHIALVKGDVRNKADVLVRVHSECLTGDVFRSKRCDCGLQLQSALEKIASEPCGILVYLRGHEGRGIGIAHKLRAYQLQDQGKDTIDANLDLGLPVDARGYETAAQILRDLGVISIRLMTNNPAKFQGLDHCDILIAERVPLEPVITKENQRYLLTKKNRMGHLINVKAE